MTKLFALAAFIFASAYMHAEVLVFTYAFNRPDFIKIQHDTLEEFLLDDYKFIVFNDAKDPKLEKQIEDMCAQLNIQCIRIPQEIHSRPYLPRLAREDRQHPSVRNCNVVQYSLNTVGFDHDDIVILLDSDMFLVKPFSAREFMQGYSLAGLNQCKGHVEYLWIGLVFLDMKNLPNKNTLTFNCGEVDGYAVDAGGHSHNYMKKNPGALVRYIHHQYSGRLRCPACESTHQPRCAHNTAKLKEIGFEPHEINLFESDSNLEFLHNNTFLHYRSGSNWDHKSAQYHQMKTEALKVFLAEILK